MRHKPLNAQALNKLQEANHEQENKKGRKPRQAIAIASAVDAVVIFVVILLLLRSCNTPTDNHGGIEFYPSATEGDWDEAETDEIIVGLNEKVEKGMINISMNTSPVFAGGTSEGSLMIVNEEVNNFPQVVEICCRPGGHPGIAGKTLASCP